MFKKRGQGQSWSLDIVIAFVVFALVLAIFYSFLGQGSKTTTKDLSKESSVISSNLDSSTGIAKYPIIVSGTVNTNEIQTLYSTDYATLKNELGIRGEFCIYVVDQYGNLITVTYNDSATHNLTEKTSVGNSAAVNEFTLNGKSCGSTP